MRIYVLAVSNVKHESTKSNQEDHRFV